MREILRGRVPRASGPGLHEDGGTTACPWAPAHALWTRNRPSVTDVGDKGDKEIFVTFARLPPSVLSGLPAIRPLGPTPNTAKMGKLPRYSRGPATHLVRNQVS